METLIQEMKRYLGFGKEEAALLHRVGPRMEKYVPELAERFYAQIPLHPNAFRVFKGDKEQIVHLKGALQEWARSLFCGTYDEEYAASRYRISVRHVQVGLEQRYLISAMSIVRSYLMECLLLEFPASDQRLRYAHALGKILDLDLNLMSESYMHAQLENLHSLNEHLARANRQLDETGRSKDEFLALVSHELRTPLNSILGFTKLILDGLAQTREEEQELLRDVFASAQHLLGLVNDILDLKRIERGKIALSIKPVDLRTVLDSCVSLIAVQAVEKNLELRNETDGHELPQVAADEVRLRQVLLNVLTNAIKFTPRGWVALRAVRDVRPGFMRLEVEDTGVGIPRSKQEMVFEKYAQADPLQFRQQGGSGLGLAISRRLITLMGGAIGIEDGSSGRGTLLWITVPLAGAGEALPARPAAARTGSQSPS